MYKGYELFDKSSAVILARKTEEFNVVYDNGYVVFRTTKKDEIIFEIKEENVWFIQREESNINEGIKVVKIYLDI